MRRSVLFAVLAAVLVSATLQQSTLGSIGIKFRRAAPPGYNALEMFVTGIQVHGFYTTATLHVSELERFSRLTKTFVMGGCPGSISIAPFHGIEALAFSKDLSEIYLQKKLTFPGSTWVSTTGIIAKRQGDTIFAKVGYGWAAGVGKQLQQTVVVKKCKKNVGKTRCWDENVTVPRGVLENEAHSISDGMYFLLYNKIADVAGDK